MIAFLRFEIVRTLRNVRFLVMLIAFPALLYLIYAQQHGMSQGLTVATLLLVSMSVYSGMGSAMFASGPQLARERSNGWMRQLRISPIGTPGWFAAKLIQAILLIIPGLALLMTLALTYGHVHLAAGHLGGIFIQWSSLPHGMQLIGKALPSYHLAQLGRNAAGGHALGLANIAVLAAWTAGLAVVALWRWRRESTTA